MRLHVLVWLLLLLVVLPSTLALTVSPARAIAQTTGEENFTFTLNSQQPMYVTIRAIGELSPYVHAPEHVLVDGKTSVSILVSPPELSSGSHSVSIVFRSESEGGQVGVATELSPLIEYSVPYDDAFLTYSLGIQDGRLPLDIVLMTHNVGSKSATATPVFFLDDVGIVHRAEELFLAAQSTERQTFPFPNTTVAKGAYTLRFVLETDADAQQLLEERVVSLGKPTILFSDATAEGEPGEILAVRFSSVSDWNVPLSGVFSAKIIGDSREWILQPREEQLIGDGTHTVFWESEGATVGEYALHLEFSSETFSQSQELSFILEPRSEKKPLVFVAVLAIVLLLLMLFFLLFKNK